MSQLPLIAVSGRLPEYLDTQLASLLMPYLGNILTDSDVLRLRSAIRSGSIPKYEADWPVFNYLYFSSNFLKSSLAVRSILPFLTTSSLKILDLGCGGGSATAAFSAYLQDNGRQISEIIAVDESPAQLNVFNKVVSPWVSSLGCHPRLETIEKDMLSYVQANDCSCDLIILSYSLCELDTVYRQKLLQLLMQKHVNRGTTVAIIGSDRQIQGVSVEILGKWVGSIPYDHVNFECPHVGALDLDVYPKFHPYESNKLFDQYINCWKNHDLQLLKRLFFDNCHYCINGEKTLIGINSVLEYWKHNSSRQKNIDVGYSLMLSAGGTYVYEWHAAFDRVDTNDRRYLRGIMILDVINGRIQKLSEFYSQKIE
jgi:SAM-dependent methyltransferase